MNKAYYASVKRLYQASKITDRGVMAAVAKGWLTAEQYKEITGEAYVA